jgi:GH35 family endo-1,4-beta-xylanase
MEPKPRDFAKRPDFNTQPPDFDPNHKRFGNKALLELGLTTFSLITAYSQQPTPIPNSSSSSTETPIPTSTLTQTPKSTETPTPTRVFIPIIQSEKNSNLEDIPDPRVTNPELFDLKNPNAPIPQLANALKNANVEGVTAEEIANNITFEYQQYQRRDKDGNLVFDEQGNPVMDKYVFGVWNLSPNLLPPKYQDLAGKIPVVYAQKTQEGWQWIYDRQTRLVPLRVFADAIGLKIGTMFDSDEFTQQNLHLFNISLISNTSAWSRREPKRGIFQGIDFVKNLFRIAKQAGANPTLGGQLIYSAEYPDWIKNSSFTNDELEQIVREHVRTFMQTFPDVKIWTVINELQSNWNRDDKIANQLGVYRLLEIAFEEAKNTNPNAILVLSDGANHYFSTPNIQAETEKDIQMIRFLKERGLIDAIAIHGHFNMNNYQPPFSKEEFARVLQAYKDLGVKVYITELDVSLYNKTGGDRFFWQAQVYQDIFTTYLQSGAGNVINFWGVRDNTSWLETQQGTKNADPLLFDDNGNVKITYYIILKTLYQASLSSVK